MNWIKIFVLFFSFSVRAALTPEELKSYDELEGEAFVARLTRDGKFSDAIKAYDDLSENLQQHPVAIAALGYAYGGEKNWKKAREVFNLGLKNHSQSQMLLAGVGLAEFKLKSFEKTVQVLMSVTDRNMEPRHWLALYTAAQVSSLDLKAKVAWRRPSISNEEVELTRWALLIDVGLVLESQNYIRSLTQSCRQPTFYSRLVDQFEKKKVNSDEIVEQALACYPENSDMLLLAIQQNYKASRLHTVVELFERLALQDQVYHHHVAEFMGSLGKKESTVYWRSSTPEENLSFKARAAQWVNDASFPHVMAMRAHVSDKLYDDPLRYATGFAFFKYKLLAEMPAPLQLLKSENLKKQGSQLIELAKMCRDQSWQCRP